MAPDDNRPNATPDHSRLDTVVNFAEALASMRNTPEPSVDVPERTGTDGGGDGLAGIASPETESDSTDIPDEPRLPVGLSLTAIQLAHALEALNGLPPSQPETDRAAGTPTTGAGAYLAANGIRRDACASEARRLVALALTSVAGRAGLDAPDRTSPDMPPAAEDGPGLEEIFAEFDSAREDWRALPGGAEKWDHREEVDRYLSAEQAVLSLADARPEVLRRQADLLLAMTDEIAEQAGRATANAIANVALGLALKLDDR